MEKFVIKKYWALLDDPFPYGQKAESVFEEVTKIAGETGSVDTMHSFNNEAEAREAFDFAKWGLHNSEVWSGDRRKYKAIAITLEREVYDDDDPEALDHIDTLEWTAEAIPEA